MLFCSHSDIILLKRQGNSVYQLVVTLFSCVWGCFLNILAAPRACQSLGCDFAVRAIKEKQSKDQFVLPAELSIFLTTKIDIAAAARAKIASVVCANNTDC